MSIKISISGNVLLHQLKLIKMPAKLDNLNNCAVPFLSRAATNLRWYYARQEIEQKRTKLSVRWIVESIKLAGINKLRNRKERKYRWGGWWKALN